MEERVALMELQRDYDVLVAGGGNAALCAALTARESGASVLVLEHAPRALRGGNSRHTRNLRVMHDGPTATLSESYPETEYWEDLQGVTRGKTDECLARMAIRGTGEVLQWMRAHGVEFQPALHGTLNLSRTNAFFLGGGKALLNAYYDAAERLDIRVAYGTEVHALPLANGSVREVEIVSGGRSAVVRVKAVVVSSGGFQANREWLREYWGDAAENFAVIRHLALNLLKHVKGSKGGIKIRRMRAAIDELFLLRTLAALSDGG